MNVPTEHVSTQASLSISVTEQSALASSQSEHQKSLPNDVEEETKNAQALAHQLKQTETSEPSALEQKQKKREYFEQKEMELALQRTQYNDEDDELHQQEIVVEQKLLELDELLKRGKENHEKMLIDLKADVYKRKATLKDMGEMMKRESAKLQRIWQKKELEINQEKIMITLRFFQKRESLKKRQLDHMKELKTCFYESPVIGSEEFMRNCTETIEILTENLQYARDKICDMEETLAWTNAQLNTMNMVMDIYDEDEAMISSSAANSGRMNSSTEDEPTDVSLSAAVMDNPPSASEVSSTSPSSEQQQGENISYGMEQEAHEKERMEGGEEEDNQDMKTKKGEENKALVEFNEHLAAKQVELAKKVDVLKNLERKTTELVQKFRIDGYLQPDKNVLRTDLTFAERLITDPMMVTYDKYVTLIYKNSLPTYMVPLTTITNTRFSPNPIH